MYNFQEVYEHHGVDFTTAMNTWLYQPGYPIISACLNKKKNVVLQQVSFEVFLYSKLLYFKKTK